jgi:hypothetical protein
MAWLFRQKGQQHQAQIAGTENPPAAAPMTARAEPAATAMMFPVPTPTMSTTPHDHTSLF